MKPCTILDLEDLVYIAEQTHSEDMHMRIRADLLGSFPHATWFLMKDTCLCYEPLGKRKYQAHIYSVSRDSRGSALRDFAIESGRWMVDNTECESILNFVEKDRRDLQFFMRMIGSKKMGEIPGTGQILYVSAPDMGIKEKV